MQFYVYVFKYVDDITRLVSFEFVNSMFNFELTDFHL